MSKSVAIIVTGLCLGSPAAARDFERIIPAEKVRQVTIGVTDADVTAIGWKENKVKVVADEDPGIEIEENTIRVGTIDPIKPPEGHMDWQQRHGNVSSLTVYLPASAALSVRSLSGFLKVEGIAGRVELAAISGDVRLSDCSGSVDLEAVSGDITIHNLSADLNARAVSGDVTIAGFDALNLEVKGVSGDVEVRGAKVRTVRFATHSGDLDYEGDTPEDGSIEMTTFSGDVRVRLPADRGFELDASTHSGEVEVKRPLNVGERSESRVRGRTEADGPRLRLKTHSGDVRVK